ncbi:unnamed protein product [Closterium sp. NIES-64]|nr:unnamed protein product [Closterium sp. NIES-64]
MIRYAYMVGDDLYDTTADPEDDPSFYYNHSCDPNTWYANPRCMVALRDIQPGEHVTYDYACTETEGSMHAGLRCRCGAACCRGTLNFTEWRSHDWQRRFAGHCSAYIERKMAESGWYDPRVVTRYKGRGADAFKGLFALASIRRGEPLLVFAGKLVGLDYLLGSDERVRELSLRVNDNLWQVPDPTRGPETPDFINHSCDPNCGLEDSVTVVALRNIAPGEELSIDYGSTNAGVVRTSSDNFSCHCGASICRGVVTCDDWRLPELRQRLWPFFPPFIKRLIVRESEKSDLKRSESDESCESIEGDELAFTTKMKPRAPPPKRKTARKAASDKGKGKAAQPAARPEPRKKRAAAPVERDLWSDKESTIFAAAKWFLKEELEPLKGKQGTQYWARLLAHIKESNPGWIRGVNALQKQWRNLIVLWREYKKADEGSGNGSVEKPPWYSYVDLHNQDTAAAAPHAVDGGGANNVNVPAGMEVPQSSQPGTSTPCFTAPPPTTPATPRRARVHETATMQAAMLVSATIKDCHGDAMNRIEGLVRQWMAQDLRLARERMTESAPPDVHRTPHEFSPPPPRGESAPAPETARTRVDEGDGDTAMSADEDVEVWVRGADD